MPFHAPEFGFGSREESPSWHRRVLENFRAAFSLPIGPVHSASGVPARFAIVNTSTRYGSAQSISALSHVAIFCGLLFLMASSPRNPNLWKPGVLEGLGHPILRYMPPPEGKAATPSLGHHNSGGANETLPARVGLLAPASSMPLTPPRLVHRDNVELPVAPAVLDPHAPAEVPLVTNLGLPWMNRDTNSAGPGKGHGIGNFGGDAMGDEPGEGVGVGDDAGNYANAVSLAACVYCPEPPYTDEARRNKLQGSVTLRVLIGADGSAQRIRIVKGLGMGLDEQALQAVRKWHFSPARDAHHQPIATWATIETRFQIW
jgi:TonB family protein